MNYLYPDNNAILINGQDLNDDDDEDDEIHSLDEGEYLIFDLIDAKSMNFFSEMKQFYFQIRQVGYIWSWKHSKSSRIYFIKSQALGHVYSYFPLPDW